MVMLDKTWVILQFSMVGGFVLTMFGIASEPQASAPGSNHNKLSLPQGSPR